MIGFKRRVLDNGLTVIAHKDASTPMTAVNLLYDVGSRDDRPDRTGTAHLLEHLMFGGSLNIPSYDREVQKAGGENNAFTSNDITNYYVTLPSANIETGMWLESDRMVGLNFSSEGLDIQKQVVAEEYRQRYLNQPYGDAWMILRPLAYNLHPYRWPVIGSDISHIMNITLDEIREFYNEHYCPSNAILTVSSGLDEDYCLDLAEKWFGPVNKRKSSVRSIPSEPPQAEIRRLDVSRDVPYDMIITAYRMCGRNADEYHATDLISDLLAGGKSARLYRNLVMEKKIFGSINAYITGDRDPGLFIVNGRVSEGIDIEIAYDAIISELDEFISRPPENEEMEKVKNKLEATRQYTHTDILHKATDLAYYQLLSDAEYLNEEIDFYRNAGAEDITRTATSLFRQENSSVLFYRANNKSKKG